METLYSVSEQCAATFNTAWAGFPDPAADQPSGSEGSRARAACDGKARSYTIYVFETHVSTLEGRGSRAASCSTSTESPAEFRSWACELSEIAPPPFQQAFEPIYGIALDELCTLASEAG